MVQAEVTRGEGRGARGGGRGLTARLRWGLVGVVWCSLLLSGCGSTAPPVEDAFFRLEPALSVAAAARPLPGTVLVTALGTRGFLGGSQIMFRTADAPLQAQRYNTRLWEDTPGRAMAGGLGTAVRTAGLFEYVVTVADRARADWLLSGELERLEHLPTDQPPRVVAEFTLTLVGGQTRAVVFSGTYAGEEPTSASTPEAMAAAFNRLTGRLLTGALADLAAATRRLAPH